MQVKAKWFIPLILGLAVLLGLLCNLAAGTPLHYNIKYGEAATLDFCLYDSNSPWALYETVPATADVNVFRDQGASESADNAVVDEGPFFSWTISAAEATAKTITLVIKDATAPPLYMDSVIVITTFGNASALHTFDLDSAIPTNFSSLAINADGTADTNVVYVRGETPEADVVDTLNTRIDGVDANTAAVQTTVDTIEGYTDDIGVAGAGLTATVDYLMDMIPSNSATRNTVEWILAHLKDLFF